jgi:hypothetical protein
MFITLISNPGSVKYPDKFKPGDKAKVLQAIDFSDGTSHFEGQIVDVTEENVSYYNVFHRYHEKVQ